jgi:hypothetical protein
MSDGEERNKMVLEFRRTVAQHPECAFHWIVIPNDAAHAITRGHASTSDLAYALLALIDDTKNLHVYGRCAHCDKLAMAFLAAERAFKATMGSSQIEGCQ